MTHLAHGCLRRVRASLAATLALALLVGCGDGGAREWVQAAGADSAAAERAIAEGRADEARARLEAIVAREIPDAVAREDARVVLQDARDRLARLALDRGALDEAETEVEAGLALGVREDLFTANLLTTRGRIHEARGEDREAAADYHRALLISEALLEAALGGMDEQ